MTNALSAHLNSRGRALSLIKIQIHLDRSQVNHLLLSANLSNTQLRCGMSESTVMSNFHNPLKIQLSAKRGMILETRLLRPYSDCILISGLQRHNDNFFGHIQSMISNYMVLSDLFKDASKDNLPKDSARFESVYFLRSQIQSCFAPVKIRANGL